MHIVPHLLLALLTFGSLGCGASISSFDIYLTAKPVSQDIIGSGKGDWSQVRLATSPLISATDIISYDLNNHSLKLRPEALARIPRPPVTGTPFVVVANGQPIYMGVFMTGASSYSSAIPSIMVDRHSFVTDQPADTIVVERAYPPSFGVGPDPRGDQRIKTALKALHKLTKRPAPAQSIQ